MSADVWDFEETDAGVDCGWKASGYRGGGRGGGFRSRRGTRFGRKEIDEQRRCGGDRGERTTPYVLGALQYARKRGATTVAITSNRHMAAARLAKIVIALEVGPEVLTGSTRLKAGTSQKMVLNMLSTAVMVRLGHVYENLMIDAELTNEKLADRALRILAEASGKRVSAAEHALRAAGHNMRVALVMLKLGVEAGEAKMKLRAAGGDLRGALAE